MLATAKLIKGSDALNAISYATGKDFGRRLVSYNTWEDRLMFKGKGETGKGARYVLANNWQKGVDVWQEAYKTEKSESKKGDLAYNIALGHEVLGNMQDAKKWITVSYVEHRNSKALRYSEIINTRIENEGILERQSKK